MKQCREHRPSLMDVLRDECGSVLIIVTVCLPVMVGFLTLAVDYSYVLLTRNMLQVTAEAAALAATSQLPNAAAAKTMAQQYAETNMPAAQYGAVLSDAGVVVGHWLPPQTCAVGTNCFTPLPADEDCVSFGCNATKVTTQKATASGNPLRLVFAPLIGLSMFDVSASAIAIAAHANNSGPCTLVLKSPNLSLLSGSTLNAPPCPPIDVAASNFAGTWYRVAAPPPVPRFLIRPYRRNQRRELASQPVQQTRQQFCRWEHRLARIAGQRPSRRVSRSVQDFTPFSRGCSSSAMAIPRVLAISRVTE
jgi:Flp pilus assembly protein TadG